MYQLFFKVDLEDTKAVIRIRISKKNRQHNDQNKKVQTDKQRSTKHTQKTKDRVRRTTLKNGSELMRFGRVSSSCSTSDIRHVNLMIIYYTWEILEHLEWKMENKDKVYIDSLQITVSWLFCMVKPRFLYYLTLSIQCIRWRLL